MPHRSPAGGSGRLPHPCGPPPTACSAPPITTSMSRSSPASCLVATSPRPGSSFQDWRPLPHRMPLPTSSPLPERSRLCAAGTGSARRAWKHAQLATQPQVIADRPVLDGLTVLEADNVDLTESDRLVGGGQPHKLPGVPSMEGAVDDHGVTVGDDLVDLKAPFGESLLDPPHGLD